MASTSVASGLVTDLNVTRHSTPTDPTEAESGGGGRIMGAEWIVAAQLGLFGRGVASEPAGISLPAIPGSIRTEEMTEGPIHDRPTDRRS